MRQTRSSDRALAGGKHYQHAPRSRGRLVAGVAVLALAVTGAGAVAVAVMAGGDDEEAAGCVGGVETVAVLASPDIAPVVTEAARAGGDAGESCWTADVTAVEAPDALARLRDAGPDGTERDAVWIPDSSSWTRPSVVGDLVLPDTSPSVALSPVVLGTDEQGAAQFPTGSVDLAADILASTRLELGLPDPVRSAPSLTMLQQLAAAAPDPQSRLDLARVLRTARRDLPTAPLEALAVMTGDPRLAVPVSEQAVWEHNSEDPAGRAAALRLPPGTHALDYPYVVLAPSPATDALLSALQGPRGRELLAGRGFRAPDGEPGAALVEDLAVDPAERLSPVHRTPAAEDATLRTYEAVTRESRLLAVLDVSGSMLREVPGGGGATRIELVRRAAGEGLNVYPDGAYIGLWEFATDLAPGQDYRELVPIGPLTLREDGRTGRQALGQALAGIEATRGDTGLYETTLAAVRAVREGYDPRRSNVVVVLTDGRNEDAQGIGLDELLATLRQENDPMTPVPVVTIAYGPDTDIAAMAAISEATGGILYRAPDPLRIGEIFLDAIARRPCAPGC